MAKQAAEKAASSGVDALIARLRNEGVTAGRDEADKLIRDAKTQAKRTLDKAKKEAQERLDAAHKEAESYKAAGEEALKTAIRDSVLAMKAALMEKFSSDVKRLVSHQLKDPELVRQMILEVAGRARDSAHIEKGDRLEVILPEKIIGVEELRRNPKELQEGKLTGVVFGLTGEMLRDGVSLSQADDMEAGIRIHMVDKDITLDLTDEAVTDLLLQHLQPRFRAVFEGVVK